MNEGSPSKARLGYGANMGLSAMIPGNWTRRRWLGRAALGACGGLVSCSPDGNEPATPEKSITWPDRPGSPVNPARGLYVQITPADGQRLRDLRARDSISLALFALDLRDHRMTPLGEGVRRKIDATMQAARDGAVRVIFRAAYGFTDADYRTDPASLERIRNHITDLGRWLQPWSRDLLAVQAGMLGPWGEWHGSTHGDPPSANARQLVWSAWREHLSPGVPVLLRRPRFLRDLVPETTEGIPPSSGWHNDALFALPDDMGTYDAPGWDRERELAWCGRAGLAVPCGGETVPLSEATPPAHVLVEMEKLCITFLNRDYHPGTMRRWEQTAGNGPTLRDEIIRRLGYCLVPVAGAVSRSSDGSSTITLTLRNHGFSRPHGEWLVEVGWRPEAGGHCQSFGPTATSTSPRDWLPGRSTTTRFRLPALPAGARGHLALRIHDQGEPDGSFDPRQCLQLTGPATRSEEATGWNVLDFPIE